MVDWCLAKVKLHDRLFSATALLILRMSALPRLDYLTRAFLRVYLMLQWSLMLWSFNLLFASSNYRLLYWMRQSLLRLPIRMGGCGIRSLLSVAPAAYFG